MLSLFYTYLGCYSAIFLSSRWPEKTFDINPFYAAATIGGYIIAMLLVHLLECAKRERRRV